MNHPMLALALKERLNDDALGRALNPAKVNTATTKDKPRKLSDGGGLYLLVLPKGRDGKPRRHWRYKYRIAGSENLYAIGSMPEIGLADARQIHRAARWLVERGIHPAKFVRDEHARHEAAAMKAQADTFAAVCDEWLTRDAKTLAAGTMAQRRRELKNDVLPALGKRLIGDIQKKELADVLKKIEMRAPEVARNVRQHMTGIYDFAVDRGIVSGSPVPGVRVLKKREAQKPHAAILPEKVGEFLHAVEESSANLQTRIAVRLLTLTAVRKVELLGAKWGEFDLSKAEWSIPAERMKMRDAHWVPLSQQAVKLLKVLREHSHGDLLFPNARNPHRSMSGNSINGLFDRLGYLEQAKPHGLRSLFSTYANGAGWNPDVVEKCLAHSHKDSIRFKYNRNDYRKEQRHIMEQWAAQIDRWYSGKGADVVPIRSKRMK